MNDINTKIAALGRELSTLKGELERLKRELSDTLSHLDGENVPSLPGLASLAEGSRKLLAVVVGEDGKINALPVLTALNEKTEAKLSADRVDFSAGDYTVTADHVDLSGKEISLTSEKISLTSDNLSVSPDGVLTCRGAKLKEAEITRGTVLGSDIDEGSGVRFGPLYSDGEGKDPGNLSQVTLYNSYLYDGGGEGGISRGVALRGELTRRSGESLTSSLLVNALKTGITNTPDGEVEGENDLFIGIERTPSGACRIRLDAGEIFLTMSGESATLSAGTGTSDEPKISLNRPKNAPPSLTLAVGPTSLTLTPEGIFKEER